MAKNRHFHYQHIALFCLFALLSFRIAAVEADHDHIVLTKESAVTFNTVFDSALNHSPKRLIAPIAKQQADNLQREANRWTVGRQSLQLNYIDDSVFDDTGIREIEAGVQFNLWRWGERQAAQQMGKSVDELSNNWVDYFKWQIAGEVRKLLADLDRAEAMLAIEELATQDAERVVTITQAMFDAGSVAQLDLMQAQSALLEQQKVLLHAEAAMVDAARTYAVITGLTQRPASQHLETQNNQEEIDAAHPMLRYLQSDVDKAEANVHRSKREAKGSPSLTLGMRRDRADLNLPYNDSLGVSVNFPFGGMSYVNANSGEALRAQVDAQVDYQIALRNLNQQLHEVEHELFITEQSVQLSQTQAQLSRQRWQMALTAFEAGEVTLPQVLLAQQQFRQAEQSFESLKLYQKELIAEFNQTIGVLP